VDVELGKQQKDFIDFLESTSMNVLSFDVIFGVTAALLVYCIRCKYKKILWYCQTNRMIGARADSLCGSLTLHGIEYQRNHHSVKFNDNEVVFDIAILPEYDVCILDATMNSLLSNGHGNATYQDRKDAMQLLTSSEHDDYYTSAANGIIKFNYVMIALSRLADKNMRLIAVTHYIEFHSIFKDNPVTAIEFMFESNFVLYSDIN
jgi:hypothetical protein